MGRKTRIRAWVLRTRDGRVLTHTWGDGLGELAPTCAASLADAIWSSERRGLLNTMREWNAKMAEKWKADLIVPYVFVRPVRVEVVVDWVPPFWEKGRKGQQGTQGQGRTDADGRMA